MSIALLLAAAAASPDHPRTFGDWAVACDNMRHCAIASLGPVDGDFPEYTLELARNPGPRGGYEITLATQRDASPVPVALVIDGRRLPIRGDSLSGPAAARTAQAMARGRSLRIEASGARLLGTVSLTGAAAALRFIDAEQGRAGGVTATVAIGPAPASQVPPAPTATPLRTTPIGAAARAPSRAQLATMRRLGRCEAQAGEMWQPSMHRLGAGKALAILPCSAGAYNVISALFVIAGGRVTPAQVDLPAGFDSSGADSQTPVPSVANAAVDGGVLTSYAKGRGLGDCGIAQSFAWDGTRLRLVEQGEMRECRGNPHFLRTWHVPVARR